MTGVAWLGVAWRARVLVNGNPEKGNVLVPV